MISDICVTMCAVQFCEILCFSFVSMLKKKKKKKNDIKTSLVQIDINSFT